MAARYLYGGSDEFALCKLDSGVAVVKNDMCYLDAADSSEVNPAGSFTWDTNLATTQTAFHLVFVGVADQSFLAADTTFQDYGIQDGKIRIRQDGVFEFDTASASYAVGDLVGPAKQTGDLLEPQKVAAVATELLAIGRVVEATASSTKVKVRITPKLATLGS